MGHSVVLGALVLIASPFSLPFLPGGLICGGRYMIIYAHLTRRCVSARLVEYSMTFVIPGRVCVATPPFCGEISVYSQPVPPND